MHGRLDSWIVEDASAPVDESVAEEDRAGEDRAEELAPDLYDGRLERHPQPLELDWLPPEEKFL